MTVSSATLYRWRETIENLLPYVSGAGEAECLDNTTELQQIADEISEAYLDAIRKEVA